MVDRVESQLLLYDQGDFADLFAGPEFTVSPRLFLECALGRPVLALPDASGQLPPRPLPPGLELGRWTPQDYQPAGELIHACYLHHMDSEINDQYRTLHGSLRFLHNIVRFPGCGVFEPNFSWVLRERGSKLPVGAVLCSRVGPRTAHVTQLCVSPARRGQGLGRLLMRQSAESLARAGFDAMTLTVTEANAPALALYGSLGFTVRHRFDAMVMDTRYLGAR